MSNTTDSKPKAGGTYAVNHSRKGNFTMHVDSVDGEWISGTVMSGTAGAMLAANEKEAGEPITVRECLATFKLIPA